MSREILYVRFPDGSIRYGVYDASVDVAQPNLYPTREEAWEWCDAYRAGAAGVRQTRERGWPVELATSCQRWTGRATEDCVTAGTDAFDQSPDELHRELPCWVAYDLAGQSGLTDTERAEEAEALVTAWKSLYAELELGPEDGVCESCGHVNDWDALHSATPGVYCDDCAHLDGWACDCEPCAESREMPD